MGTVLFTHRKNHTQHEFLVQNKMKCILPNTDMKLHFPVVQYKRYMRCVKHL